LIFSDKVKVKKRKREKRGLYILISIPNGDKELRPIRKLMPKADMWT
jgi:uncharacterized protein YacL